MNLFIFYDWSSLKNNTGRFQKNVPILNESLLENRRTEKLNNVFTNVQCGHHPLQQGQYRADI